MILSLSIKLMLLSLATESSSGFVPLPAAAPRPFAAPSAAAIAGRHARRARPTTSKLFGRRRRNEDSEDPEEERLNVDDLDWKAFQARLVQSEPMILRDDGPIDDGRPSAGHDLQASAHGPEGELPLGDWRAFRARLVRTESHMYKDDGLDEDGIYDDCEPASGDCDLDGIGEAFFEDIAMKAALRDMMMAPAESAQWAYESGAVIEQGTVVLGGVDQDFGFGLRQQYFHKASLLIVDHQESTFTKGIILNRPTDFELEDDINPGLRWKVWFGGDVQGIESDNPDIICLHTITSSQVVRASVPIMNEIQWTTFENAKRLVHAGLARPSDFQVFCGYAGWGPGQLRQELDRKSWYMVATDSQTLLKEMAATAYSDPRDAGLETWSMLMRMIGKEEIAQLRQGGFDDLMLKEWSLQHLLSNENGGNAGRRIRSLTQNGFPAVTDVQIDVRGDYLRRDPVDQMMERATAAAQGQAVMPGHLVRASPVGRSPFLLDDQELHKSVILILSDDDKLTVGAILNRPAAKGVDIQISRRDTGRSETVSVPLRFGGQYSVNGEEPLLWVHRNENLRAAGIGMPVGPANTGIFRCTAEEVTHAIRQGYAAVEEFFVITGVSVWMKEGQGDSKGMQGEIESGRFEIIPPSRTQAVWNSLSQQQVLTEWNMKANLEVADEAWSMGGAAHQSNALPRIDGRAGNFNQEDMVVFKSNVKVSQLADDALMNWVATFLLGVPIMN